MAAVVTAAAVSLPTSSSTKPSASLSTTNPFISSGRIGFNKVAVQYRKNVPAGGGFAGKCLRRRAPTVAVLNEDAWGQINEVNQQGPYLGLVVPNSYEMNPLLQSPKFVLQKTLDFAGRRFRIGKVADTSVIMVMTGLGMLNAGVTTQLLASLFNIKGILHHGIAGNANPDLQIGDVTIAKEWAHTGLWNWQRFGDGPDDELALEANGDYTREVGYINFSEFNSNKDVENYLNKIWYQPEEVFPVDGKLEERQHAFWIPVNEEYYALAKKLEALDLGPSDDIPAGLARKSKVFCVERGICSSTFLDNAAYREFLRDKFNPTPMDMESAAVALVSFQQRIPFIIIRSLSDLAGGGSSESNEAVDYSALAAQNAVDVLIAFISSLQD